MRVLHGKSLFYLVDLDLFGKLDKLTSVTFDSRGDYLDDWLDFQLLAGKHIDQLIKSKRAIRGLEYV